MMRRGAVLLLGSLLVLAAAAPTGAFESNQTFQQGSFIWSFEGGGGSQSNLEGHARQSSIDLWYVGARLGWLPFDPLGADWYRGALEVGLEPIYQAYTSPKTAYYAGLAAVAKYHVLSLGRFVPYAELGAAAGGTNLKVIEIDSSFAFWLGGGVGASYFLTDTTALYAGYRMVHISNGNTDTPNRGFEAHTGVAGVSFFFK